MRLRRVLVVHPTQIIRNMIKNQILSEFTDVVVLDAPFEARAVELLEVHEFSAVVCDVRLLIDKGVLKCIRGVAGGANLAVIAVCGPGSPTCEAELQKSEVKTALQIPFTSLELKQAIDTACNPRAWRRSERIHIPDVMVSLHAEGRDLQAVLINISSGGLLCEVEYDGRPLEVLKIWRLTIELAGPDFMITIKQLTGRLSKLAASSWQPDGTVAIMRLAFLFTELNERTQSLIDQLLAMAKNSHVDLDSEVSEK
ncbi:MAG: hypothetical protein A2511_15680 [Deltaproteobacteria bacterium RIFOXYD12_FULL_50_9]|nr:MAG: hypothetical protein A2511_15680 [Deltaproteobacteria bacterium RIFOXYD12_FULL_50_9]